jgi:hypothetical protein
MYTDGIYTLNNKGGSKTFAPGTNRHIRETNTQPSKTPQNLICFPKFVSPSITKSSSNKFRGFLSIPSSLFGSLKMVLDVGYQLRFSALRECEDGSIPLRLLHLGDLVSWMAGGSTIKAAVPISLHLFGRHLFSGTSGIKTPFSGTKQQGQRESNGLRGWDC